MYPRSIRAVLLQCTHMRALLSGGFLEEPTTEIPRCGAALAMRLRRLNINTVQDLLHHIPIRYEDQRVVQDVRELHDAEFATVRVRIAQLRARRAFYRRGMNVVEGLVGDETSSIRVVWFNQSYIAKNLVVGDEIFLSGKVSTDKFGLKMTSPTYEKTGQGETLHTARIVPIYGLTEGISNKQFRTLVKTALDQLAGFDDWMPAEVRDQWHLPTYNRALHMIHFPTDLHEATEALQRFQFDEAFLQQLNQRVVQKYNKSIVGCPLPLDVGVIKSFIETLPFTLTDDQRKAAFAIIMDMEQAHPMNRLLQGDVGSGKTVVAAIAVRHVASHGSTALILAPTQILAEQHAKTLARILAPAEIPVVLMTASTKKTIKLPLAPYVVVGTHALLHDKTKYPQLALVVVDEQHRFGVAQRKAIKDKNRAGYTPHFLSMSATPIPRSLALMVFGSLAVSSIRQMPAGRKVISTRAVDEGAREKVEQFVRDHVARGEQAFVVAPLIDPSDILGIESATEVYERLKNDAFKDLRVGLVHGRIKQKERAEIMEAMRRGEIDVLVATAVIEVGVDIPNATVMWIEGAERFGLAQLHQFRGRVGRGDKQSYCFLFSKSRGEAAKKRLEFMEQISDGFTLAEKDLEMRGGGDMWGTLQSGFSEIESLRTISLDTWGMAKRSAEEVVDKKELSQHPLLQKQLERFERELHRE